MFKIVLILDKLIIVTTENSLTLKICFQWVYKLFSSRYFKCFYFKVKMKGRNERINELELLLKEIKQDMDRADNTLRKGEIIYWFSGAGIAYVSYSNFYEATGNKIETTLLASVFTLVYLLEIRK